MIEVTETIREFAERKAASQRAQAQAARITVGAVGETTLIRYDQLERIVEHDALHAEWAGLALILRYPNAENEQEQKQVALKYLTERVISARLATSSSAMSNLIDNQRITASREVLRQVTSF